MSMICLLLFYLVVSCVDTGAWTSRSTDFGLCRQLNLDAFLITILRRPVDLQPLWFATTVLPYAVLCLPERSASITDALWEQCRILCTEPSTMFNETITFADDCSIFWIILRIKQWGQFSLNFRRWTRINMLGFTSKSSMSTDRPGDAYLYQKGVCKVIEYTCSQTLLRVAYWDYRSSVSMVASVL